MSGLSPTGGLPTAGSPVPAGSGDLLISGTSGASFLNAAAYHGGALFSAGGGAVSFVGLGHSITAINDGFVNWTSIGDVADARVIYRVGVTDTFADTVTASDANSVIQASHVSLTQGLGFSTSGAYVWTAGGSIVEVVRVSGTPGTKVFMQVAMTEWLQLAQRQVIGILASISEHMALSSVVAAYLGTVILNRVLMSDTPHARMKYAVTLVEAMQIASIFQRFVGATVEETITLSDTASAHYRAVAKLVEFLSLAIDQHYAMAFRVSVHDTLDLSADALLAMIYRESMSEIIDLDMLFQSPNGTMTAWAINTRTQAVTEYQGWEFNSFVQMGNKYIAASKDGLFELNGPTDAGLSVVADIMGGFIQPAGQHLAGLKGVYLGQTGQGYWLLKIDTGDGREYVYQKLSNPGLMSTKFNIGKGLNARYIGWELINVEGQDFDLDSIEFVPMLRTRRV